MKQAYKVIEQELRKYPNNENAKWKAVCDKVFTTFRWRDEYTVLRLYYLKNKSRIAVCAEASICENTFTNWRKALLNNAYTWAIADGIL